MKSGVEQLALWSARPAFPEMLHVGRPNIGNVDAFLQRVAGAFERRWLTNNGVLVQELEARLADQFGTRHCLALANGTQAIELMLRAGEVSGEVIVPAYTFVATVHAVRWIGLKPVFADVDPHSHNLPVAEVERLVTPQTSAILGVHLWGRGNGAEELEEFAARRGIKLFFDAAHAFGCNYRGRPLASYGIASTLSFHATKCFHTFEGGALATNDDDLAARIRLMRNFGFAGLDSVVTVGTNSKMNEISAAMGLTLLDGLDEIFDRNRSNYEGYRNRLSRIPGLRVVEYATEERSNFQYVVVEVDADVAGLTRDELAAILGLENIAARRYFTPGCHRMEPYRSDPLYQNMHLPVTERLSDTVLCLPSGTAIRAEDIDVIGTILELATGSPERCREQLRARA